VAKYLDKKIAQMLDNLVNGFMAKKAPKPLVVDDISGALFVLAFGFSIAGVVLLLELLHERFLFMQRRRN